MMERDLLIQLIEYVSSRRFGKYRGTVVSNEDPTHRGRLKVTIPAVLGSIELWALPCVPYAGKDVGLFAMPPKDSAVWLEFEGGDTSQPIWVGSFWADKEAPLGGDPTIKVWKTDAFTVSLDDKHDEGTWKNDHASVVMKSSVVTTVASAKHTVDASAITSELETGKVEVSSAGVNVNSGKWQVL